jgi:hypothetical protein
MAKTLLCGGTSAEIDASTGWYVEGDLGNPVLGCPGTLSLFHNTELKHRVYLGASSIKYRLEAYLSALATTYEVCTSMQMGEEVCIHLQNWT